MDPIASVLESHPELRTWLGASHSVLKLGGLTNSNTLLECEQGKFVLRIPGRGTEEYINRGWEKHAANITSELGVNAPVIYFNAETGVQLARFLDGAVTMDSEKFRSPGTVSRAARSFRRVHDSGKLFSNRFELFAMIDNYLDVLKSKGAELPPGFPEQQAIAERVRVALNRHENPLVPCHCDPLAENFLDTGEHMFIVDWEYSGNNDPMWDLADLSVEASFLPEQEEELLRSYFDGQVPAYDRGRMVLYKAMCDLLWTLWGILQHANQNPADDFKAYASRRLGRCANLMATADFEIHLRAVMAGRTHIPVQ